MCGRFTLFSEFDHIIARFAIDQMIAKEEYTPSYNIAPSQQILAVINDGSKNRLGRLQWGFIPPWSKDEKIGYNMINARAETLSEKPSFRKPLVSKRCIIPADGFYEWKRIDAKTKQPMRIKLKSNGLFSFAALWEKWQPANGKPVYTCTVITTKPNDLMKDIHDRMPVILNRDGEKEWLHPANQDIEYLESLLKPYPSDEMEAYEVADLVNSPKNNSPQLIKKAPSQ
ncbi:SOS response-associated peptidase [Bacillus swezeyi]|nr:SOS response-associated peptidase [Bacillus swezeyi]MEC1262959.1 SOS response-associated peptidase [Bacillus swezeyi]MED1742246.1 SOS response-associated peptidase [Bacillus swezeyi]MED2930010.1 SOS response-associated peptidase [Bacillus swezeyi]MED2944928.1 SOS response-associated peptidase [Bacillus swezeyi]MED2963099.1 SOS response-associated peptidase [Bacillus swezeyi]